MNKIHIISDNKFFSLGVSFLLQGRTVSALSPLDVFNSSEVELRGVFLVYIKNKFQYRQVCGFLRKKNVELIFFIDFGVKVFEISPEYFWDSKLTSKEFIKKIKGISENINSRELNRISELKRTHLFMVEKGVSYYMRWVLERAKNKKSIHANYRVLVQALNIENVSIHNIFLSEIISIAYVTICDISKNDFDHGSICSQ